MSILIVLYVPSLINEYIKSFVGLIKSPKPVLFGIVKEYKTLLGTDNSLFTKLQVITYDEEGIKLGGILFKKVYFWLVAGWIVKSLDIEPGLKPINEPKLFVDGMIISGVS